MKTGVKNIQAAAYNGAHTVHILESLLGCAAAGNHAHDQEIVLSFLVVIYVFYLSAIDSPQSL